LNGYKEEYPNCKFPAFNSGKTIERRVERGKAGSPEDVYSLPFTAIWYYRNFQSQKNLESDNSNHDAISTREQALFRFKAKEILSCSKAICNPLLAPRLLPILFLLRDNLFSCNISHYGDLNGLTEKIELHLLHGYTQYKMGSFWPIKPAGRFTPESSGEVTIHASCNFGRMSMDQRYVSYKLTTLKLTAKDATVEDLQTLFGIDFDASRMESMPWQLRSEPYDVPRKLGMCPL
jgi:hypothetical protein